MEYHRGDAASAREHFDALIDLYAVVFAEPPYEEGPQMDILVRDLTIE